MRLPQLPYRDDLFSCAKQIIDPFRTANHNQIESFIMNFRNDLTNLFDIEGCISIKDRKTADCPEHVPPKIKKLYLMKGQPV